MGLKNEVSYLAVQVAKDILLPNFARVYASFKDDGSLLTQADIESHEALTDKLPQIADYPVLSEEMAEPEQLAIVNNKSANYWCIDPLDGTSNYTTGIPYWCISIALIEEGRLKLGIVYDPNRDECFAATDVCQSTLNGSKISTVTQQVKTIDQSMGLVDFKRLNGTITTNIVSNPPYLSHRNFGASALELCWIANNRCQLYLHGKQKLWDYSAGLLILQQAGGQAETFDGDKVFQNDLIPKSILAASNAELQIKWLDYYKSIHTK